MIVEIHGSLKTINDRSPFWVWMVHPSFEGIESKLKENAVFKTYFLNGIERQIQHNASNRKCKRIQIVLIKSHDCNEDILQFSLDPRGMKLLERNKHMFFCAGYLTGIAKKSNLNEAIVPFSTDTFRYFEKEIKSSFRKHLKSQGVFMRYIEEKAPD